MSSTLVQTQSATQNYEAGLSISKILADMGSYCLEATLVNWGVVYPKEATKSTSPSKENHQIVMILMQGSLYFMFQF